MKALLKRFWWFWLIVFFGLIQLLPYGKDHQNPPVYQEIQWSSPQVRSLAVRACYDCHSNEVTWPWYSNIAPISWIIQNDIDTAREVVNFSDFVTIQKTGEMREVVLEGEMPPLSYVLLHPSAMLSDAERQQLADGLAQSFGK